MSVKLILNKSMRRWALLCVVILAIILVPYFLAGAQLRVWTDNFLKSGATEPTMLAIGLALLLALDILLPVPSSVVSTAAGFTLGFAKGAIVSLTGMITCCVLGFGLGAKFGRAMACRLVGHDELQRLERLSCRFGDWVIVLCRPVPVLAEASVLFAGISRLPIYRFLLLSTLANLGISVAYAAIGAFSATANSLLLAFAGSVLVPLIAMFVMNKCKRE